MACCDFFEPNRDEPAGNGEKDYREHVAAHKLSFGEIIVVVAAVVMLAGMSFVHQDAAPEPRITGSISASSVSSASTFTRCDDDNHYLSQRCER